MGPKSRWAVRVCRCPEENRPVDLLVEWKIEKGKKTPQSVSCNHPGLADLGGRDCAWRCVEKLSGRKKQSPRS